ncbi:MAG: hypothetical protein ABH950_03600 [Candidatus Altiarchaeota archaeon]
MPFRSRRHVVGLAGFIVIAAVLLMVVSTVVWFMYSFEYAIEPVTASELTMEKTTQPLAEKTNDSGMEVNESTPETSS